MKRLGGLIVSLCEAINYFKLICWMPLTNSIEMLYFKKGKGLIMADLIKTIEQFETPEAKTYWIFRVNASNEIKGRLLFHFRLI